MKKHEIIRAQGFEFISKENMSEKDWLLMREEGLGGSDSGTILGLNPYASSTELFYQRLGLTPPPNLSQNENVHWGNLLEEIIRHVAQYYDFNASDRLQYISNCYENQKLRSIIEPKWMIRHEDYPWLILNLDGMGYEGQDVTNEEFEKALRSGEVLIPDAVEEIKTISKMASERWESGVPPGYVTQVTTYMIPFLAANEDIYARIFSLEGGVQLEGFHIPFNNDFAAQIVVETKRFWELLQGAKEDVDKMVLEKYSQEEIEQYIDSIAPEPPTVNPSYVAFLSERLNQKKMATMAGTEEWFRIAEQYKGLSKAKATVQHEMDELSSKIKKFMLENNVKVLDYSDSDRGRISFNKRLYCNIK